MRFVWLAVLVAASGCGDNAQGTPDAMADATLADAKLPELPALLIDTGLYADANRDTLADGVREYTVNYPLWTDAAEKRRFIWLPPDTTINAVNVDFWRYPEGTKVWKQFSLGGSRLETRLLYKDGPFAQDWKMVAYIWNESETEATISMNGAENVLGTDHDVPGSDDCRRCHRHQPDIVIGVGGVQLNHNEPGMNLSQLITDGLISSHVEGVGFDVPDGGDPNTKAALGYLHGNCGVCHHDTSDVPESITMRLWLTADSLTSVQDTTIYQTAVGGALSLPFTGATSLIEPGDASSSAVYLRMSMRGDGQMPPLGTEQVDTAASTVVETWINSL